MYETTKLSWLQCQTECEFTFGFTSNRTFTTLSVL